MSDWITVAWKHLFGIWGGEIFNMQKMQNPSMFGIDMLPKETQSIFSKRRLVPGKLVIVSVDMYGKIAITGEWMYSIAWKHVLSFMFFLYLFICFTVQKSFLQFFIFLSYISLFKIFFSFFHFQDYNNIFTCKCAKVCK